MPESPHPQDNQRAAARRGIRWDALAAIIASLVGFLALLVAGYTAYIQRYTAQVQREQVEAQVWPYVELGDETSLDNAVKSNDVTALVAANKGVGPARIRGVEILVDGRPQPDRRGIFKAMGMDIERLNVSHSTFNGTVLSPGEMNKYLVVSGEGGATQFSAHVKSVVIRVCYASTLGEYWIATTDFHGRHFGVHQVRSCASIPVADEFHG